MSPIHGSPQVSSTHSILSPMQPPRASQLPAVKLLCAVVAGAGLVLVSGVAALPALPVLWWLLVSGIVLGVGVAVLLMNARPAFVVVYCAAAFCAGGMMALRLQGALRLSLQLSSWQMSVLKPASPLVPLAPLPAVLRGRIVRVLRRDSSSEGVRVRCLVRGWLDAKALPRLGAKGGRQLEAEQSIALTVRLPHAPRTPILSPQISSASSASSASSTLAARLQPSDLRSGVCIYAVCKVRLPRRATLRTDFDEARYYAAIGVDWLANADAERFGGVGVVEEVGTMEEVSVMETLEGAVERISEIVQERLCALFPAESRGFALALLTGDRRLLPAETQREYSLAGTAHVLAVSGLHIALLAELVLMPLAAIRFRSFKHSGKVRAVRNWRRLLLLWLKWTLFVAVLLAFVALTGGAASGVRAAAMAALVLALRYGERQAHLLNVLGFVVLALLLAAPRLVLSVSFQLSVGAVCGIVLLYPLLYPLLHSWLHSVLVACSAAMLQFFSWLFSRFSPQFFSTANVRGIVGGAGAIEAAGGGFLKAVVGFLASSLALTLASSLVIAPLVAWEFGIFSLVSPLANLVVVPLSSLAMCYALAALLCSGAASWLSLLLSPMLPSYWLERLASLFASAADALLSAMNAANAWAAQHSIAAVEGASALVVALVFVGGTLLLALLVLLVLWWRWRSENFSGFSGFSGFFDAVLIVCSVVLAGTAVLVWWQARLAQERLQPRFIPRTQVVAVLLRQPLYDSASSNAQMIVENIVGTTAMAQALTTQAAQTLATKPSHRSILILQDRNGTQIPFADQGLERFVAEECGADSLLICTTGPASLFLASRIASRVGSRLPPLHRTAQPPQPPQSALPRPAVTIFSTSLCYKQPRQFAALDSLDALAVPVLRGELLLRAGRRSFTQDSERIAFQTCAGVVQWLPWKAGVVLPSGRFVSLPQMLP
jgi:ComEC/Rec2-related protein